MTLEELSITYTADIAPALGAMDALRQALEASGAQADALEKRFSLAGQNAAQGLARGIAQTESAVVSAARKVAQSAENALRSALEIHSPSKVTQELGRLFAQGFTGGIGAEEKDAASAAHRMAQNAAQAAEVGERTESEKRFAAYIQSAGKEQREAQALSASAMAQSAFVPEVNLTIPLEIDGYRLGVAAVNGLNLVSRGSGSTGISI